MQLTKGEKREETAKERNVKIDTAHNMIVLFITVGSRLTITVSVVSSNVFRECNTYVFTHSVYWTYNSYTNFCISVTYVSGEGSVHRHHFLTVLFTSCSHELQLNHCTLGLYNVNHAERSRFASAIKSGPSCRELSLAPLNFRLDDVTSVPSELHQPSFFTVRGTSFPPTTGTLKLPSPTNRTVSAIRRKFAG